MRFEHARCHSSCPILSESHRVPPPLCRVQYSITSPGNAVNATTALRMTLLGYTNVCAGTKRATGLRLQETGPSRQSRQALRTIACVSPACP